MKKRILSLLCVLALCLGLLPATALAAAPIGQVLYVGGVQISSTGYWTTDSDGNVTASTAGDTPTDNYIHYDAENNVLTLHNATIKKGLDYNESIQGGTYINGSAIGVFNQNGDAELTITLEGTNTIAEVGIGIFVLASSASTGSSNLTIQGDGSLNASASQTGIWVQSNSNNAALCVENAEVTASSDVAFKNGVLVQAKDGSDVSLTVNGGSLTASVNANIWFQFGSGFSGSGTPTVTVSNNAIVRANGGIANNSSTSIQYRTGNEENGGIVFDGSAGTVYGSVTLQDDLEIKSGETLTIGDGASLTVPDGKTLTNNGTVTVEEGGTLTNNGSLDCNHHTGGTATCTEKAKCDLCGAEYGDFLPHSLTKTEAKAPTCTVVGNEAYWTCGNCGKYFSDGNGNTEIIKDSWIISAINHDWNDAVYTWSDDGSTCTATRTCKNDSAHTEKATATVTGAQTKAPTCTQMGETTYTAAFEASWAMTQTKVLADIPAIGHSYDNGKCTVCGAIASDFKVIITAGANGSWQKGTKDGLTFTSNAANKYFQKVQVDGKDLDASNYTVKEGSTIVTLKTSYLETLSVGKHTLAIVSETGTATTEFTIKAAAVTDDTQSPQTGDDSNIALWIAVLLAAGTALTGTAVYSRKRKYSK